MPALDLIRITAENLGVLERLMQLYLYDFSVYFCGDEVDGHVNEMGLFDPGFDLMRYVDNPRYEGYLARAQGIGEAMARQTFDTFRGFWQVMQIAENEPAIAFWRAVIGEYTGGRYREFPDVGGDGQRQLWQTFDTGSV